MKSIYSLSSVWLNNLFISNSCHSRAGGNPEPLNENNSSDILKFNMKNLWTLWEWQFSCR